MALSRCMIAVVVVAAAAISGAALAADASSSPAAPAGCPAPDAKDTVAFIKNPKWLRQPTGFDVDSVYPPHERLEHKTDRTVMDCAIADDGSLKDCTVVEDKKPGKGFDKGSLALAKLFKMSPLAEQPAFTGMPECVRKLGAPHVVIPIDWHAGG